MNRRSLFGMALGCVLAPFVGRKKGKKEQVIVDAKENRNCKTAIRKKRCCLSCQFANIRVLPKNASQGFLVDCHRNSPGGDNCWPDVQDYDWCGEWKLRENLKSEEGWQKYEKVVRRRFEEVKLANA